MTEADLLLLWGKSVRIIVKREGEENKSVVSPDLYHPLLFHLLDVGHVAGLLWDKFLSPRVRERLAQALGLSEPPDARRAVVLLAALHDIGKASPAFQHQNTAPANVRDALARSGLPQPQTMQPEPHGFISAAELIRLLQSQGWVWSAPSAALILAHISGAHHGTLPSAVDVRDAGKDVVTGDASWSQARRALADAIVPLLEVGGAPIQSSPWEDAGAVAILAGLISVADWLGSSEHFQPAGDARRDPPDARSYAGKSKQRAREALQQFGWVPRPKIPHEPLDFTAHFGFGPNPLQSAVIERCKYLRGPFLAIAEAPMGTGKTEAAFAAVDAALVQEQASGFYIALPTQATGNAMHDRVRDNFFAHARYGGNLNLQLVHSHALLKDDLKVREGAISEDAEATVAAQSWFTQSKRPLLAPFGAGTIDQSLMGVLQTRHWFVRLFGLCGKVVVFDEIHSYQVFTGDLLARLLTWLHALDCSVLLLSATLPPSRRHELLRAWGIEPPESEADYPRLTWADAGEEEAASIALPRAELGKRTVKLSFGATDAGCLSATLKKKLAQGGCAAIICNTVKRAQEVYAALKSDLGEDWCEWRCFHARMPFAWRQAHEEQILKKLGKRKANCLPRPSRAVVVSTQVLEQSLDISFDWMASDLAPVDLLLQRAGRLHRHEPVDENKQPIERPLPVREAELCILCDVEDDAPPKMNVPEAIYAHHVLLRTWLALRAESQVALPDDVERLIKEVYEGEATGPDEVWESQLRKTWRCLQISKETAEADADSRLIPKPASSRILTRVRTDRAEDEDPQLHEQFRALTRQGLPSIQAVCLCQEGDDLYLPDSHGRARLAKRVDLQKEPGSAWTRKLVRAAVPLSLPLIYRQLKQEEVPPGWRKNSHLRFYRVLKFRDGRATCAGLTLLLDAERGIVILDSKEKDE